jgi:hypothetical protein
MNPVPVMVITVPPVPELGVKEVVVAGPALRVMVKEAEAVLPTLLVAVTT